MTRIGRFVAGVGAALLGLVVMGAFLFVFHAIDRHPSPTVAMIRFIAALAIFGCTAAAFYTWAVDGPFVRRRDPR
jgi:drug/metabolite transporter (DMT)-like permease